MMQIKLDQDLEPSEASVTAEGIEMEKHPLQPRKEPLMTPPAPDLEVLLSRLANLEKQCRRMKRAAVVILIFAGALLFSKQFNFPFLDPAKVIAEQDKKNVVEAQRFHLVDENGKLRAVLGTNKGETALVLQDENGKERAKLMTKKETAILNLFDEKGKSRVVAKVAKDESGFHLLDANEKFRVVLGLEKRGPILGLHDDNGKMRVGLDASGLLVFDGNENPRAGLVLKKQGPILNLIDDKGKGRLVLSMTKGAALKLLDEEGKVLFSKP